MSSDLDDLFDDMAEAEGSNSGVFFTEGLYGVELKEVEFRPNGYKGKSVIHRFTVTESSDPTNHPVGATRVWICKLDKGKDQKERTFADIKALYFALLGKEPSALKSPEQHPKAHAQVVDVFKAHIDSSFAEKSKIDSKLCIGRRCKLEAAKITTKPKDGKPAGEYTRHVWSPMPAAA